MIEPYKLPIALVIIPCNICNTIIAIIGEKSKPPNGGTNL